MRFLILVSTIFVFAFNAYAQLYTGISGQVHYDHYDLNRPFGYFFQPMVGFDYTQSRFNIHLNASTFTSSAHLEEDFSYDSYGSFGGPGNSYGDIREGDASFQYTGFRLGADYVFWRNTQHFNLLLGLSHHIDFLVSEEYTNMYQTTWTYYRGDPPWVPPQFYTPPHYVKYPETKAADFSPLLDLEEIYQYTNLELKPRLVFEKIVVEFQLVLTLFAVPRLKNKMINKYYDYQYTATYLPLSNIYMSNEFGISVKYKLGKRSTTSNKTPAPR